MNEQYVVKSFDVVDKGLKLLTFLKPGTCLSGNSYWVWCGTHTPNLTAGGTPNFKPFGGAATIRTAASISLAIKPKTTNKGNSTRKATRPKRRKRR